MRSTRDVDLTFYNYVLTLLFIFKLFMIFIFNTAEDDKVMSKCPDLLLYH